MIGRDYEKKLVSENFEVRIFRNGVPDGLYFRRHEAVELAHAGYIRLALHHLLAGVGDTHPQQNPVWRIPRRTGAPLEVAPRNDGTLGKNDPGGAREIPQ